LRLTSLVSEILEEGYHVWIDTGNSKITGVYDSHVIYPNSISLKLENNGSYRVSDMGLDADDFGINGDESINSIIEDYGVDGEYMGEKIIDAYQNASKLSENM